MKRSHSLLPVFLLCIFLSVSAVPLSPFLCSALAQEPESLVTSSAANSSSGPDGKEVSLETGPDSEKISLSADSYDQDFSLAISPGDEISSLAPDPDDEDVSLVSGGDKQEEMYKECPDLAATGSYVWNSVSGQIFCTVPTDEKPAAELPVSGLLSDGETTDRLSLASWDTDSIMLCIPVYTETGLKSVELFELGFKDGSIEVLSSQDAGGKLRFLYDDEWLELDMISNHKRLLFAALDQDFMMHFYLYTPSDDTLVSLGERELSLCRAVLPYGEDVLMAEQDDLDESVLRLSRFSLKDGSAEVLYTIPVSSSGEIFNFACDENENRLYFTANNVVYTVDPKSNEAPVAIGSLNAAANKFRLGILTESSYVCQGTDGTLLSCDLNEQITVKQLVVADTMGIETLTEAAEDFNLTFPEYTVSVLSGKFEEDVLTDLQSSPEAYDAYVLTYGSDTWRKLSDRDMMADLGENVYIPDMPSGIRNAIYKDGHMAAFPVSASSICHLVNPEAFQELTGLSREEIPTDIVGFLDFLYDLAENGTLKDNQKYSLYDDGISTEQYREIVLDYILEKALLLSETGRADKDVLKNTLQAALETFQTIDFEKIGLSEADTGRTPLFSDAYLQIEVMDNEEEFVYWPISFMAGSERLIPQTVSLLCVNPHSPEREATIAFANHIWDKMEAPQKMALSQNLNDPVPNVGYKEDLAYLEGMADELAQLIANETDPVNKRQFEMELEELNAYTQRYRLNAQWVVSEDSLLQYRSFEDDMVPFTNVFWTDTETADAQYDFLEGRITPDQLIQRLEK